MNINVIPRAFIIQFSKWLEWEQREKIFQAYYFNWDAVGNQLELYWKLSILIDFYISIVE